MKKGEKACYGLAALCLVLGLLLMNVYTAVRFTGFLPVSYTHLTLPTN